MGDWRPFVYGGAASTIAELATFPLDTSKTRLQVQGQKLDKLHTKLKYKGVTDTLVTVSREEGITALYKGVKPAILRQCVYGTLKIGLYYNFKKMVANAYGHQYELFNNVICGIAAGSISTAIASPTDLLKVRLQAGNKLMSSELTMTSAFYDILKYEGMRGLYRGALPTMQRGMVIAGLELPVYDKSKQFMVNNMHMQDGIFVHGIGSFIAGLFGALGSTPLDVARTRIMNQRIATDGTSMHKLSEPYRGTLHCIIQTLRHEGFFALYKGFTPIWMRMAPWNIIFFISYEQMKKIA